MWSNVKLAAREGVVIGVKWGTAAILTLWALSWALGDYATVRDRAQKGEAAFDFLQRQVTAQQQQQATLSGTPGAENPGADGDSLGTEEPAAAAQ